MANSPFPLPPSKTRDSSYFPSDLIQPGRQFYTEISFSDYNFSATYGSSIMGGSTVRLPLPRKINDNQVLMWEEWSGTEALSGAVRSGIGNIGGRMFGSFGSAVAAGAEGAISFGQIYAGQAINPYMFMMFKRPGYKEFTFQWTLVPNNQQESDTLKKIVNTCKRSSLPSAGSNAFLMKYPKIANVKFHPDQYLFKMKPCAVVSVQVDYTGAGIPSFFNSKAPTVVNLTLQLKEIQLWSQDNYEE